MTSTIDTVFSVAEQPKSAYSSPELIDYGPIESLTQGAGGGTEDGLTGSIAG